MLRIFKIVSLSLVFASLSLQARAESEAEVQQKLTAMANATQGQRYLLAIGMTQFDDPLWQQLKYPTRDARSMYEYFTKKAGFENADLVTSEGREEGYVSRNTIVRAFSRLSADSRNDDDVVVVYVSAHGTLYPKPDGSVGQAIVTSDTRRNDVGGTGISFDELYQFFDGLRSRRKVLIIAACHSGVGKSALSDSIRKVLASRKGVVDDTLLERSEGSLVLMASRKDQPAEESDELKHDVYTHFLIEGFSRGDINKDGGVSITEAHQFATWATDEYTRGRQTPSWRGEMIGRDAILVSGKVSKKGNPFLYAINLAYSRYEAVVNGQKMGILNKGITLPEGKARVQIVDPANGKTVADRWMRFDSGREYSVKEVLEPTFPDSAAVGTAFLQFGSGTISNEYAPNAMAGVTVTYAHEQAVRDWTARLEASYFPPRRETISISNETSFSQQRSMVQGNVTLESTERLRWLSAGNGVVQTNTVLGLGPSLLLLSRRVDSPAFRDRTQRGVLAGGTFDAGLDVRFPLQSLIMGVRLGGSALANAFEHGPRVAAVARGSLSLGMTW